MDLELLLKKRHAEFERIIKEIENLFTDHAMMHMISGKTWTQITNESSEHMYCRPKGLATIHGHSVEVVRYYCDTFNKESK